MGIAVDGVASLQPLFPRHSPCRRAWSNCRSSWRYRPACVADSLCCVAPPAAPSEGAEGREGAPHTQLWKWAVAAWSKGARQMVHAARTWGEAETIHQWCRRCIDASENMTRIRKGGGSVFPVETRVLMEACAILRRRERARRYWCDDVCWRRGTKFMMCPYRPVAVGEEPNRIS